MNKEHVLEDARLRVSEVRKAIGVEIETVNATLEKQHSSQSYDKTVRAKILEHFSGREGTDFTTLGIMEGEGWEKICPFLGIPAPRDVPFPHWNQKAGRQESAE